MMTRLSRLAGNPWMAGPLLGIALGLPVLGVGGRVAMRVIAYATNAAPAFSIGGTMTVVGLGAVSGAAGGLIYSVLARVLPNRAMARALLFATILLLLTLRGLSPATPLSLSLFLPLTASYGALFDYLWRRRVARPSATLTRRFT